MALGKDVTPIGSIGKMAKDAMNRSSGGLDFLGKFTGALAYSTFVAPFAQAWQAIKEGDASGIAEGIFNIGMFAEGESPYRLEGMGGNVVEWCSSRPDAYPYREPDGRERTDGGPRVFRVGRGGGWPMSESAAR